MPFCHMGINKTQTPPILMRKIFKVNIQGFIFFFDLWSMKQNTNNNYQIQLFLTWVLGTFLYYAVLLALYSAELLGHVSDV